jgi:hypothetical protein
VCLTVFTARVCRRRPSPRTPWIRCSQRQPSSFHQTFKKSTAGTADSGWASRQNFPFSFLSVRAHGWVGVLIGWMGWVGVLIGWMGWVGPYVCRFVCIHTCMCAGSCAFIHAHTHTLVCVCVCCRSCRCNVCVDHSFFPFVF